VPCQALLLCFIPPRPGPARTSPKRRDPRQGGVRFAWELQQTALRFIGGFGPPCQYASADLVPVKQDKRHVVSAIASHPDTRVRHQGDEVAIAAPII
jgi:hypothetical protein